MTEIHTTALVSIVYLTKNGGQKFRESLNVVFSQLVDFEYEVIVVDSGSTDGTLEYVKSRPVRLYEIPPDEFNFGLTRDFGFSLANGEILIAISQDAIPVGSSWLKNITSPFKDPSVEVVQAPDVLPPTGRFFYWERIRLFSFTRESRRWIKAHNNIGLSFTGCAIRRRAWETAHLGRVEMNEDKVFQKKIADKGYKIVIAPDATNYHAHTYTLPSLVKRCENEGLGWRMADQGYSLLDMLLDLVNPVILLALIFGIITFRVRSLAELLFPVIRPIFVFKGNHFTRQFVR